MVVLLDVYFREVIKRLWPSGKVSRFIADNSGFEPIVTENVRIALEKVRVALEKLMFVHLFVFHS